jgi:hypothetical protein
MDEDVRIGLYHLERRALTDPYARALLAHLRQVEAELAEAQVGADGDRRVAFDVACFLDTPLAEPVAAHPPISL